jgi:uncharacterized Fe-S cluster-containing radical SAM superfamily protein
VRYFLTGRQPAPSAVLLVESGSRRLIEGLIPRLRGIWGDGIAIDLFTCFPAAPRGLAPETARVYRAAGHHTLASRWQLVRALARNRYTQVGIVCSGEPILAKWKWAVALALPAKVFVINENGDYFWLDRKHLGVIFRFAFVRSGLAGAGAVRTLARVVTFPFTLVYLLLYAAAVHLRRALRGVWRARSV